MFKPSWMQPTFSKARQPDFRAGKNASSGTVQTLLRAAVCLRQHYADVDKSEPRSPPTDAEVIPMSKEELEQTADDFRRDLGLKKNDLLHPFFLVVDSVTVERLRESSCGAVSTMSFRRIS
jgi:hypothetical protein